MLSCIGRPTPPAAVNAKLTRVDLPGVVLDTMSIRERVSKRSNEGGGSQ